MPTVITSNLIQNPQGAVYYYLNGTKYWIDSPASMTAHNLSWSAIQTLDPDTFNAIPTGYEITSTTPLPTSGIVDTNPVPVASSANILTEASFFGIPNWMLGVGALGALLLVRKL